MPGAANLDGLDEIIKDIKLAVSTGSESVDTLDACDAICMDDEHDCVVIMGPKDVILHRINIGFAKIRKFFQESQFRSSVDQLIEEAFASFETWVDRDFAGIVILGDECDDGLTLEESTCREAIDRFYSSLHALGEELSRVDDKKSLANAGGSSKQPPKQQAKKNKPPSPWGKSNTESSKVADFIRQVDSKARQAKQAHQEKLAMQAQEKCKRKEEKSQRDKGIEGAGFFRKLDEPPRNRANGRRPNGFAASNRR